jgi:hypothetical protein
MTASEIGEIYLVVLHNYMKRSSEYYELFESNNKNHYFCPEN